MGSLQALMMFVNMVGGVFLLPTLVNLFRPRFVVAKREAIKR